MRFETFEDAAGAWRWRLVAVNGRIVADSGESYTRKYDAERAIETVTIGVVGWWNAREWRAQPVDPAGDVIFDEDRAGRT